ncbi:TniQ family protein [Sphaerospermopsis torques-reginae]|uniref:TniQ family protein n=1 Tax=Sphaerospermopsis torques-reginae ITEP-024 TaxID=984208 RepID=A0ABX8X2L9_9CYAN|nr:TniQ family protein [Sphaerospermopsis torques-reginae]QYX32716.1 TniQ family protein [Sphaerospermopsis torques-reginae ITEP-024]
MKPQTPFIPCEQWDLKIPNLPPRSRLYSLQPIGLGTPYTESLSSYLQRLAQHHHLRPWQLYTHCLTRLSFAPYITLG